MCSVVLHNDLASFLAAISSTLLPITRSPVVPSGPRLLTEPSHPQSRKETQVTVVVPVLTKRQAEALPSRAREVVEYRKSGLSLNHIRGCPLDCAYCIQHTYGLWDQRQPQALMSDAEATELLVSRQPGYGRRRQSPGWRRRLRYMGMRLLGRSRHHHLGPRILLAFHRSRQDRAHDRGEGDPRCITSSPWKSAPHHRSRRPGGTAPRATPGAPRTPAASRRSPWQARRRRRWSLR
jgi:hypothetical protein